MGYSLVELGTAAKYKLPLIAIVYNNNCWGSWVTAEKDPQAMPLHMFPRSIRYDLIAEQLGVHGEYVSSPQELRAALGRSYDIAQRESRPVLINVASVAEFTSPTTHPPGFGVVPEPSIGAYWH
jgi:thiamine pyrophosphate-dependent acetolactate synthase large subunit-like protein